MPVFQFKAVSPDGEIQRGVMEEMDQATVIARIQELGNIPICAEEMAPDRVDLERQVRKFRRSSISSHDVVTFTQEITTLLQAGIPLDRALGIAADVTREDEVRKVILEIQKSVREGSAFSEALAAQNGIFSGFYLSMVRTGEASGNLDTAMDSLLNYLERHKKLKSQLTSALVYPAILTLVAGASVLVILAYVVPQFTQLFADMGQQLPLPTRIVVALSELVRDFGWVLMLIFLVAIFIVRKSAVNQDLRRRWDQSVLKLPLAGELVKKFEMSRFSLSMGTLLASGVSLVNGLSVAREVLTNKVLSDGVDFAIDSIKEGSGMAEPLTAHGHFPELALQMIKVGEETGKLEDMMRKVADVYDQEVSVAIQRLLTLLEPVLIVGLGLVIAGIILSIMVAVVQINDVPI